MTGEPNPQTVADEASAFREEVAEGADVLETILAVDENREAWTFDDLPLDSGTFGELVSRGLVTRDDDGYRVASREGVRAGLEGRAVAVRDPSSGKRAISVDPRAAAALLGALAVLFATRMLNYPAVFYGDRVVSPGNDPYYYRYWTEQLLAESNGVTDLHVLANLPAGPAERRPFTHAANWFFASLLGGDQWAADAVAAWLPVVATLALGVVVYWLAILVTEDVRVAVASVLMFALAPIHAVYSGIGFLEHRPYQYFWLGVTLLALAWTAVDLRRRLEQRPSARAAVTAHLRSPWTWAAAVAFGVALTFSMFAWGGSVLMLVPVAIYVGLRVALDSRADLRPARTLAPILGGLGVCGALAGVLHVGLGWHEVFVVVVPLLVVVGGVVAVGLGELWRRSERSVGTLIAFEALLVVATFGVFRALWPDDWARVVGRAAHLLFWEGTTEGSSMFSAEIGGVFGPMAQIGAGFYLALFALLWACWTAYKRYRPEWLLLAVYVVFWLALASIQVRFAAQLTIPLSVLAGLALVYMLAWADVARLPKQFRGGGDETDGDETDADGTGVEADGEPSIVVPRNPRTLVPLVWLVVLVCSVSLFFVPTLVADTAHDEAKVEAAAAIGDHAAETDREFPDNYVLSDWGDNRMYNYFVSGWADNYGFALNNFDEFRAGDDPDAWYGQFPQSDVGYVVVDDIAGDYPETATQAQLHDERGTGGDESDALEHYQAVYVDDDVTAFAVVPGATIVVDAPGDGPVTVETETSVSGETIAYEREATPDDEGRISVTVPYPGEYDVDGETVEVTQSDVENGETVELGGG